MISTKRWTKLFSIDLNCLIFTQLTSFCITLTKSMKIFYSFFVPFWLRLTLFDSSTLFAANVWHCLCQTAIFPRLHFCQIKSELLIYDFPALQLISFRNIIALSIESTESRKFMIRHRKKSHLCFRTSLTHHSDAKSRFLFKIEF